MIKFQYIVQPSCLTAKLKLKPVVNQLGSGSKEEQLPVILTFFSVFMQKMRYTIVQVSEIYVFFFNFLVY